MGAMKMGLSGIRVVSFESRLSEAMAESIRRHGGEPISAPTLREVPLEENIQAFAFGEKLMTGKVDMLICLTGVGTRLLLQILATRWALADLLKALQSITVVARGPKPVKVLRDHHIPITLTVPEPNTWRELLEALDVSARTIPLDGKTVAVQEYGISNEALLAGLKERGAYPLAVPVYRWDLPKDTSPLLDGIRQIIEGKVGIALFTNAAQVRHLMRFASGEGLEKSLRSALKKVVIASVGPTTSEALREEGLGVDFEPSHPKMGVLVQELAEVGKTLMAEKQEGVSAIRLVFHHLPGDRVAMEASRSMREESPFIKACKRQPVPVTPVWLMRQAGRYMRRYRKIRDRVPFLELCKNPTLAAEVAVCAWEYLKADAAILFSDLLLIVEPMGLSLDYLAEEGPAVVGFGSFGDIDRLKEIEPAESLAFVFEAVRLTRAALDPKVPLIGFAGAPFTLAAYVLEGGTSRSFLRTKGLMLQDAGAWRALMEKLVRGIVKYSNGQIEAGADAIQLFDTWVGCLGPEEYVRYVLPYTKAVIEAIHPNVPIIHFTTGTGSYLNEIRKAGADVVGVDWRVRLDRAWAEVGYDVGIQGNLDPAVLLGPLDYIRARVKDILNQAANRPGHIFNLGHGILPNTPEENVVALVDMVHELSRR